MKHLFVSSVALFLASVSASAHSGAISMFDDFDPDVDQAMWLGFGATVAATTHAGSVSGANSLKFSGSGTRYAETIELDTRAGGHLRFYIRLGNGDPFFETADLPGDGVVLEYADEANTNWVEMARFDTVAFRDWTLYATNFPTNLGNEATRFRWRQLNHAGGTSDLWALDDVGFTGFAGPPTVLAQPQGITELLGTPVSLTVLAAGEQPLSYQWRHNGSPLAGATNVVLDLGPLAATNGGSYSVVISNVMGTTNSSDAVVNVFLPTANTFKVQAFTTNNNQIIDVGSLTGDDRGGIGVSSGGVFRNGDTATGRYNLTNLTDGVRIGRRVDTMVSDLRTRRLYALGNGTNELTSSAGLLDSLVELDDQGAPTGKRIPLSRKLSWTSGSAGIFSGWGRVMIFVSGTLYDVRLPSGFVSEMGSFSRPAWELSEISTVWGVVEHYQGEFYLRYVNSAGTGIVRRRISDGRETIPDRFSNLGQTHSIVVAPALQRWYFTHESSSEFGGTSETLGFADAVVTFKGGDFAPTIDVQPENFRQLAGREAVLRIQAAGSGTLAYQWRFNGSPLAGQTNAVLLLPAVQLADGGDYSVTITNSVGSVTSSAATLTVLAPRADRLKILGLGTNNLQTVEVNGNTGDDRGGIALSTNRVLLNGDTRVATFVASDLSGAVNGDRRVDALCADLQTRTIYAFSDGTNELTVSGGTLRELSALKGGDATPAGSAIVLRTPIELPAGRVGIFSGWGRIAIYANGRVYEILLPSGDVADLGPMPEPGWSTSEAGEVFGVVENFGGSLHLAYARTSTETIERSRVPDGLTEVIATFDNIGDLGGFAVSPELRRWFFSYEGTSQFGSGTETLGSADAFLDIETLPQPPGILSPPRSRTAMEGAFARFAVGAVGVGTLSYQWLFNGGPISGGTKATLLVENLSAADAGNYSVTVSNAQGSITSGIATLTVQPLQADTFQILGFGTNNALAINASSPAGDDRGGMALSANRVFHNGDSTTAIYDTGLTNPVAVGRTIDGLCYDIRTMTPYALGNGTNFLTSSGGVLNSLIELNPGTGAPTGRTISLNARISMTSGNGIFSGYGRLIIYASGRFYDIALPSGIVTDLGAMTRPSWQNSEIWSTTWGVAEKFLGSLYVVYHRSGGEDMVRTRIPDGATTVITSLTEIQALASFAVNPVNGRWYFHYEGLGQFFPSSTEVLGSAEVGLNRQTVPQAPVLTLQPQSRVQLAPRPVEFRVQAFGTPPLAYQWLSNGVAMVGETSPVLSMPTLSTNAAADYSVVVSNAVGSVTSTVATLTVLPPREDFFKVETLLSDNVRTTEVNALVGDDRAGLAVSGNSVFVTGDTETRILENTALTNVADLNRRVEGLVTDYRTGKVYALANGSSEILSTGLTVDRLLELDPNTGAPTGVSISLSRSLTWTFSSSGIFSGFGRFLFYTGGRIYEVLLPEGVVFDHGVMTRPSWATTELGPAWGVAESFGGGLTLLYSSTANETIERVRIPDGAPEVVSRFSNLGDIAAIGLSLDRQRWYFRHEGTSEFASLTEVIGYADAELSYAGAPPVVGIFDNPQFVDTDDTPTAESDNVRVSVGSLGFLGRNYNSLSLATLRRKVLIIPDLEKGSPLNVGQTPGPVILGGDDLTDHGSVDANGNTRLGWLYIQNAIANLNRDHTRQGPFTADIAALGSASSTSTSGNGGAAIGAAASALGLTVDYRDGATEIQAFFDALRTNGINPKILWLAGTDTSNDLEPAEGAVLSANAGAIAQFVAEGGGLMSHGGDDGNTAYGWLNTLFPQVIQTASGTSSGHRLTDLGRAEFPLLSDANIDSGPSHNWFGGDLSLFRVLGIDANDRPFILGARGSAAFDNRQRLINMVAGGGVLIVHGSPGTPGNALTLLNELLGSSITGLSATGGGSFGRTAAAAGTPFADDPATLMANNDTLTLDTSTLPTGAESLWESQGDTLVASFSLGSGRIVYLGWDWNDAQPAGTQLGGWDRVLESAIGLGGTNAVTPPVITVEPGDTAVTEGGSVSLSVVAVGSAPLNYQWRHQGTNLAGATGSTLVISGVSTNHAGRYDVVVSNPAGMVTSRQATLTVAPAIDRFVFDPIPSPQFLNTPFNVTVRAIDGASNVVSLFKGTVGFNASVTVQPGVSGVFTNGVWRGLITITNEATGLVLNVGDGSGNTGASSPFDVTQPPQIAILEHPQSQVQLAPRPVEFDVRIIGAPPISYQWRSNGVDLAGATSAVFRIPAVSVASAADYSVRVSNAGGTVVSSAATLTVLPARNDFFRVDALLADNVRVAEVNPSVGDDRAGIAVVGDKVFATGDTETWILENNALTNVADLNRNVDGLVNDYRSGKVYAMAAGTNEIVTSGAAFDRLLELDPATGVPTGSGVSLSRSIVWNFSSSGVFSGFGRMLLYTDGRVYEILLPEGTVFDHGPMSRPAWAATELGATWGIAESFNGELAFLYANTTAETVERVRIPGGAAEVVSRFNNLGDIAAIGLSLDRRRWYFRHEGTSQFSTFSETLGYADAEISYTGARPVVGVFDNPQFVDTDNTPTAESDNVQATVGALNYFGRTYDSLSLATLRRDVLIIPDLEKGSPLNVGQVPGPVILGGDDLTDHGSVDANGNTRLGWLYIQNAIANLNRDHTRPGPFTADIAALGSAPSSSTSANGGGAIGAAAAALGLTVDYRDGAAGIQAFFDALRTNGTNPKILWLAGTDTSNDLDSSEGAVLSANAGAIAQFVAEGGGLMAHGGDDGNTAYGWLNTLFPQIVQTPNGTSGGHRLTDLGRAEFPLLTDANIDSGPSHNWFGGDLSQFRVLGLDANDRPFILGARGGAAFDNRQRLINMVAGGGVLIVHGSPGTPTNSLTLLNELLGAGLTGSTVAAGGSYSRTAAADGTTFADDPATLAANNETLALDMTSLPTNSASLWESGGQTLVASFPLGGGRIVYLGWDWNDAQPAGTQLGGWANVLDSAIALKATTSVVAPVITSEPQDSAITAGGSVSLSVLAVGSPPLSYQWRFHGTNLVAATNSTLVVSGVGTNHAGPYDVVVSNSAGSVTSRQATLSVLPPIDHFVFDQISTQQTVNTPFSVTIRALDGNSNVVSLFKGTVSFSAAVPVLPAVSGVFTNGVWRGFVRITNEVTGLRLNVNDGSGHTGVSGAFDVVQPQFSITGQPQDVVVNLGANVLLSVSASGGAGTLTYQWFRNGGAIAGATTDAFSMTNVNRANAGLYRVVVSDGATSIPSRDAVVRVRVPQRFLVPLRLGNGHLRLRFGDSDGGSLGIGDLAHFRVEGATNLVDWRRVTNSLVLTNGAIEVIDAEAASVPHRFYRVLEQ